MLTLLYQEEVEDRLLIMILMGAAREPAPITTFLLAPDLILYSQQKNTDAIPKVPATLKDIEGAALIHHNGNIYIPHITTQPILIGDDLKHDHECVTIIPSFLPFIPLVCNLLLPNY